MEDEELQILHQSRHCSGAVSTGRLAADNQPLARRRRPYAAFAVIALQTAPDVVIHVWMVRHVATDIAHNHVQVIPGLSFTYSLFWAMSHAYS